MNLRNSSVGTMRRCQACGFKFVAQQAPLSLAGLIVGVVRDRLKVALDSARAGGTGQPTLDASAAWNTARLAVDKAWAKAVNADVDVQMARATKAALAEQVAAVAKSAAQPDQVDAPAITAAAHVDDDYRASDATGYSGSGSKDVHVNGYTRKDGTYVHSHERSSPGSGSSHGGHK